jgi:hypothetical protein
VYVARESDGFVPRRISLKPVTIAGTQWRVFRRPSVSPDGKTIFFEIPDSVVGSTIMSRSLTREALQTVGGASDYCVIWGGAHSGQLILQRRHVPVEDASHGVQYRCYLRHSVGQLQEIAEKCDDLGKFAAAWSRSHRGSCTPPMYSEKWPHSRV